MADNNLTGEMGKPMGEMSIELKREMLRKIKAQVNKYEQEIRTMRLEFETRISGLVSKEEVERGHVQRIAFVKAGLLSLPATLAPQLEGLSAQEIQTKMHAEVIRLLEHFSRQ
jgi:predicted component of type VI protein secretion system